MTIIKNRNLDQVGLIADSPALATPVSAFQDANNVRFENGAVEKMKGHVKILEDYVGGPVVPTFIHFWRNPNQSYYIIADQNNVYAIDIDKVVTQINSSEFSNSPQGWNAVELNGGFSLVLNNGVDAPHHLTANAGDTSLGNLEELPGWASYTIPADAGSNTDEVTAGNYNVSCGVIASYENFLVAGNLQERLTDGTIIRTLTSTIRTSAIAAPGQIPQSWNPFNTAATTEDEFELADTSAVQAMVTLSGRLVIYTQSGIHSLQSTNNNVQPIAISEITKGYGASNKRSVIEFDGKHFVVGSSDIYIWNGNPTSIRSISEGRVKDLFYDNLHPITSGNLRVIRNIENEEVWVCFPNANSTDGSINEAVIYNYRTDRWTKRDLPNIVDVSIASIEGGGLAGATIDFSGTGGSAQPEVKRLTHSLGAFDPSVEVTENVTKAAFELPFDSNFTDTGVNAKEVGNIVLSGQRSNHVDTNISILSLLDSDGDQAADNTVNTLNVGESGRVFSHMDAMDNVTYTYENFLNLHEQTDITSLIPVTAGTITQAAVGNNSIYLSDGTNIYSFAVNSNVVSYVSSVADTYNIQATGKHCVSINASGTECNVYNNNLTVAETVVVNHNTSKVDVRDNSIAWYGDDSNLYIHTISGTTVQLNETAVTAILSVKIIDNKTIWVTTANSITEYNRDGDTYTVETVTDAITTLESQDNLLVINDDSFVLQAAGGDVQAKSFGQSGSTSIHQDTGVILHRGSDDNGDWNLTEYDYNTGAQIGFIQSTAGRTTQGYYRVTSTGNYAIQVRWDGGTGTANNRVVTSNNGFRRRQFTTNGSPADGLFWNNYTGYTAGQQIVVHEGDGQWFYYTALSDNNNRKPTEHSAVWSRDPSGYGALDVRWEDMGNITFSTRFPTGGIQIYEQNAGNLAEVQNSHNEQVHSTNSRHLFGTMGRFGSSFSQYQNYERHRAGNTASMVRSGLAQWDTDSGQNRWYTLGAHPVPSTPNGNNPGQADTYYSPDNWGTFYRSAYSGDSTPSGGLMWTGNNAAGNVVTGSFVLGRQTIQQHFWNRGFGGIRYNNTWRLWRNTNGTGDYSTLTEDTALAGILNTMVTNGDITTAGMQTDSASGVIWTEDEDVTNIEFTLCTWENGVASDAIRRFRVTQTGYTALADRFIRDLSGATASVHNRDEDGNFALTYRYPVNAAIQGYATNYRIGSNFYRFALTDEAMLFRAGAATSFTVNLQLTGLENITGTLTAGADAEHALDEIRTAILNAITAAANTDYDDIVIHPVTEALNADGLHVERLRMDFASHPEVEPTIVLSGVADAEFADPILLSVDDTDNAVSTSIDLHLGEDLIITLAAHVASAGDSDREMVAQRVVNAINSGVENPDYTATLSNDDVNQRTTIEFTGVNPFNNTGARYFDVTINNNGITGADAGDLSDSDYVVTTQGLLGPSYQLTYLPGDLISGNVYEGAITAFTNSSDMASSLSQIQAHILANTGITTNVVDSRLVMEYADRTGSLDLQIENNGATFIDGNVIITNPNYDIVSGAQSDITAVNLLGETIVDRTFRHFQPEVTGFTNATNDGIRTAIANDISSDDRYTGTLPTTTHIDITYGDNSEVVDDNWTFTHNDVVIDTARFQRGRTEVFLNFTISLEDIIRADVTGLTANQVANAAQTAFLADGRFNTILEGPRLILSAADLDVTAPLVQDPFGDSGITVVESNRRSDTDPERPWSPSFINHDRTFIISIRPDRTIHAMDLSYQFDGTNYESFIQRERLPLEILTQAPELSGMWIKNLPSAYLVFDGGTGMINVKVTTNNQPGSTVDFDSRDTYDMNFNIEEDYKIDCRQTGRYPSYRISDDGNTADVWKLIGVDFDIIPEGDR